MYFDQHKSLPTPETLTFSIATAHFARRTDFACALQVTFVETQVPSNMLPLEAVGSEEGAGDDAEEAVAEGAEEGAEGIQDAAEGVVSEGLGEPADGLTELLEEEKRLLHKEEELAHVAVDV